MTTGGRAPDDVIITARDIYSVTLSTAGKVDALVAGMAVTSTQLSDHEQRLRRMEARFFGIVGTFGLSAFALIVWILEAPQA
jgi:hypothetical protein